MQKIDYLSLILKFEWGKLSDMFMKYCSFKAIDHRKSDKTTVESMFFILIRNTSYEFINRSFSLAVKYTLRRTIWAKKLTRMAIIISRLCKHVKIDTQLSSFVFSTDIGQKKWLNNQSTSLRKTIGFSLRNCSKCIYTTYR